VVCASNVLIDVFAGEKYNGSMKRLIIVSVGIILVALLGVGGGARHEAHAERGKKGEICITFDDLPVVRVRDRIERLMLTDEILYTLEEYGVISAGFAVGDNIEDDIDILEAWLEMGHTLGNHTWSHPDLNDVPSELYIADIKRGHDAIEEILNAAGQKKRYFRYPSLHYGNSPRVRGAVADYLEAEGYNIADVSVDTDDFAFNLQFEKIYQSGDSIKFVQLGNEYLDHIMERLEAAEILSEELLGRQIKHILLLHANRLNSNFLGDLLSEIETRGYTFISLEKALSDPVFSIPDSYMGLKGLSVLERLAKTDPDLLPARER
jgi:peptidoglycan/xylan/chitin deacetylase (PgdA/CDA1 family)